MEHNALVFDIETIADLTVENRDTIAKLASERELTPEHYGGLCPPLARVVCIAWYNVTTAELGALCDARLSAGDLSPSINVGDGRTDGAVLRCILHGCDGEAHLLGEFGRAVEQHLARANAWLVTYNGRGFDLPVLVHRSIKHGVTEGRHLLAKAAQENRYRPSMHLDLMDAVTFAGAAPRWPLAAYAIGYGFRSPKAEMDASQVWPAIQAGRLLDVVRYCAGDVLATAHLYRCTRDALPP